MAKVKQAVQVNVAAFMHAAIMTAADIGEFISGEAMYPLAYAAFKEAEKHSEYNLPEMRAQGEFWAYENLCAEHTCPKP